VTSNPDDLTGVGGGRSVRSIYDRREPNSSSSPERLGATTSAQQIRQNARSEPAAVGTVLLIASTLIAVEVCRKLNRRVGLNPTSVASNVAGGPQRERGMVASPVSHRSVP
jgi:hypothetical protein